MKYLKSLTLLFFLIWLSLETFAQTNRLIIPDLLISRASEAFLSVNMDNSNEVTAIEFVLEVPDGFTLDPASAIMSERATDHQITARYLKNGRYKFVIMSQTNALINGIAGLLFTIRMKSTNYVTNTSEYPMTISNAVMSDREGRNVLQETNCGKIIVRSLPNLHVISLDCSDPVAGQQLTVKWKVRNDGSGSTGDKSWKDYIWLVPNISAGTSMSGSKLLKTVDNLTALLSGESYENTVNVTLAERIYGNYDLVVTSNMYGANRIDFSMTGGVPPIPYDPEHSDYGFLMADGSYSYVDVIEEGEYNGRSDNFFYKRINIQVPPLADIQVPHVVAVVDNDNTDQSPSPVNSAGLASSSAFYSGKTVKVTATIANIGSADVDETYISNVLYISDTPDMSSENFKKLTSHTKKLTIKTGESVTVDFTTKIPYEWYGDTYFIVEADVNDEVFELANNENNKGASDLINTLLTPGADFEPYELVVPNSIILGIPFDISYKVQNIGPGDPFSNTWMDYFYISEKGTGLDETAKLLGKVEHKGRYELFNDGYHYQGDSYNDSYSITMNKLENGTYYFYIKVDADNSVFEFDGEDNNVIISEAFQVCAPDLTAEVLSVSEDILSTDDNVAVSWKLKNIGSVDIQNVVVVDGFYAKRANDISPISLGSATNTVSIVAGGEKTLHTFITIPKNRYLNGEREFYMITNINNTLKESNTSNNTSSSIVKQFSYAPNPEDGRVDGPNLTVYGLQVASSEAPGEIIPISYKIKNTGSVVIDKDVKQNLFISKSDILDSSEMILPVEGSLPTLFGLKAGETATANVNIRVPNEIQGGMYYIHVVINQDKAFSEKKYSDNHVNSSFKINGNLPNLTISDIIVPNTVMTSEKFNVSWKLSNIGDWESESSYCLIYLSKDGKNRLKELSRVKYPVLAKGEKLELNADIEFEDDVTGKNYLIIWADNKTMPSTSIISMQSPLPDLEAYSLSSEGTWIAGNEVHVKATVRNSGDSETRSSMWTDAFYLSKGYELNTNHAIKLGEKTHVGKLEKGNSYDISADFVVPSSANGYYVLFIVTDLTNRIIEKEENNNRANKVVQVEKPIPADLAVSNISMPVSIMAGEPVTISYTIVNQSEFAANGKLRDAIYLSKDNHWDEDDTMVGAVAGVIDMDPGTEITRNVIGRITNMTEGNYYLILRTNSSHTILESDYNNNQIIGQNPVSVNFSTLSLGESVPVNTSGIFKLPLHSGLTGKTIGLYLSSPENSSAGLYASYESVPSTARFDRAASDFETIQQEVLIPDVQEGNYYILAQDNAAASRSLNEFVIDGETEISETLMTLSANEVPFGASSLSITEGGTNGSLSTMIHGALFDSIMDFRLTREGEKILTDKILYIDPTSSHVTFNLNDAEIGSYDVVSELPNGTQATLANGFRVVPGQSTELGIRLILPSASRSSSYAPISIAYANSGNTDIVIKEIFVTATNAYISTSIEGLKKYEREMHVIPDYPKDRRGYVTIPPGTHEVINCYISTSDDCTVEVYIVK